MAYAALLGASFVWQRVHPAAPAVPGADPAAHAKKTVTTPDFTDEGGATGRALAMAYREWPAVGPAAEGALPIILVHGSPGTGDNFDKLGPRLAARGHWVIAPDMPGFGDSTHRPSSYSVFAHARGVLTLIDALRIERAHVLGWSMGGGVVLNMAELEPRRIGSITMLAAIGDERTEGSGSYAVEHAKYALGRAGLIGAHAILPHFGLLPDPRESVLYATMRNFGDTDQRPLTPIMERLQIPTLIIAGRDDFLVPLRAALLHHRLIRPSRLVVMDAMHFMPFLQAEETAGLIGGFIERDASAGAALTHSEEYLAPARVPPFGAAGRAGVTLLLGAPWWVVSLALAAMAWRRPFAAVAVAGALMNALVLDWGVGLLGIFLGTAGAQIFGMARGMAARGSAEGGGEGAGISLIDWRRRFDRSAPGFWLAWRAVFRPDVREAAPRAVGMLGGALNRVLYGVGIMPAAAAWTLVACAPPLMIAALIALPLRERLGWAGTVVSVAVLWLWVRSFVLLFTWTGRRMLLARFSRLRRHEYWHPYIFYTPLVPYLLWLVVRHRHILAFSACNPGIARGGGLIGESKTEILDSVRDGREFILSSALVPEGLSMETRTTMALEHIGEGRAAGPFPIILKPDSGLRGFAVRVASEASHVGAYMRDMTRPAMVQRYHPGPHEVGVLWVRDVRSGGTGTGRIYSITRKDFPYVEGDGRHTLEQLIYRHPRHRCQARTFLARHADRASWIVPTRERVRLALSGNHCQGTLFRDGADLVTPQLLATLDRMAFSLGAAEGNAGPDAPGGLDFARFDLRFESEEELRQGRGFGIVEINGTTGESTNLYDPSKSLVWSYRVLFGQWRLLFELGAWRRSLGVKAWSVPMLLRALTRFYRNRPGSAIAD